jgi:3-methylcrotonyl-CoA carboxylase alpha subunit
MNTRLQVEHPVTEEITGQDLVEWQLRVASGEPLPKKQDELSINGHAIEARLYAEDPAKGFLPSVGKLKCLYLGYGAGWTLFAPEAQGDRFPRHRIETGVEKNDTISEFYDPMIAKLVAKAGDRTGATEALARSCDQVLTWPVKNNAGFLSALLREPSFVSGDVNTGFIAEHGAALTEPNPIDERDLGNAASLLFREAGGSIAAVCPHDFPYKFAGIWQDNIGFRLNGSSRRKAWLRVDGSLMEAPILTDRDAPIPQPYMASLDGGIIVVDRGWPHFVQLDQFRGTGTSHGAHDGEIEAPMPGRVTAVEISQGEKVAKGQRLLTLEAMKMEHALTAPFDGTVAELNATPGAQVTEGQMLVKVTPEESSSRT